MAVQVRWARDAGLAKLPLAVLGMADAPAQLQCPCSAPTAGLAAAPTSFRVHLRFGHNLPRRHAARSAAGAPHTHLDAFRLIRRRCRVQQAAAALHRVHCIHAAAWAVQPMDQRAHCACMAGPGQGRRRRKGGRRAAAEWRREVRATERTLRNLRHPRSLTTSVAAHSRRMRGLRALPPRLTCLAQGPGIAFAGCAAHVAVNTGAARGGAAPQPTTRP